MPLSMAAMTRPPSTACEGFPRPPNMLVPPITAAATAYSTSVPPSMLVDTDRSREAYTSPAIPAVNDDRAKAAVRTSGRLMPARRAASGLPPMAYTYRPNLVRPRRNVHIASTPRTMSRTHGTPRSDRNWVPRFVLQMSTITTPTAAAPAIFNNVKLAGGATRPLRRRRASRDHDTRPNSATTAIITIQLAVGDRIPLARSE